MTETTTSTSSTAASATSSFEVLPRDLSPYRKGNIGIDYVHRFESGRPGPHVLINALTHGNEFCGMVAAARLLDDGVRPLIGTLDRQLCQCGSVRNLRSGATVRKPSAGPQPEPCLVFGVAGRPRGQPRTAPRPRTPPGGGRRRPPARHSFDQPGRRALLGLSGLRAQQRSGAGDRPPDGASGHARRPGLGHAGDPARSLWRGRWPGRRRGGRMRAALFAGQRGCRHRRHAAFSGPLRPDGARPCWAVPGAARRFELLQTYVIKTPEFRFVRPCLGFEVFARDELIATDGPEEIRAPCDDCTILMPARAADRGT